MMKLKLLSFVILILELMLATSVFAQTGEEFILEGKISGLKGITKLYLTEWPNADTLARTIAKDGKFRFTGKVNGVNCFWIRMDTLVSNKPSKAMWLMNKTIKMQSNLATWPELEVIGSEAHDDYKELLKRFEKIKNNGQDSIVTFYKDYIKDHPNSLYIARLISKMSSTLGPELVIRAYENLTHRAKNSHHGLILKKEIEQMKLAEQFKEGGALPDFKLSTADGQSMSVLEYAKKGKITLIDFWASWCKPCREETPNMKIVYAAFHEKGFNIIGVSTDKNEGAWKKALVEENTPWFHGRDNLEDASKGIFAIGAIPAFALVDGEGKMIAFSCASSTIPSFGPEIRGEALYKTIEELLTKKLN